VKKGKGFDLEDFKAADRPDARKMGGMSALVDKLPAQLAQGVQSSQMDEKQLRRVEGIINSMTPAERMRPESSKPSRKRRMRGAGVPVHPLRGSHRIDDASTRRSCFFVHLRGLHA